MVQVKQVVQEQVLPLQLVLLLVREQVLEQQVLELLFYLPIDLQI
jgi:hypothetical protein